MKKFYYLFPLFFISASGLSAQTVWDNFEDDTTGKLIAQLASETQAAGQQRLSWDGSKYSNGIYFIHLR